MTPTPAEARADLFALLEPPLDNVDSVYDFEPHQEASGPCYVTVELDRITPTEMVFALRIYSQMADSPSSAAATLDVALASVDDRMKDGGPGPSEWQIGYDDALGALVARSFVNYPRVTF